MYEWEFVVTGRIIVSAHCKDDAVEAALDAAKDVFIGVDSVEWIGGGGLSIVKDNA